MAQRGGGPGDGPAEARLTALVRGRVQGVGFRWWACDLGRRLGLVGWARNLDDGRVEIVAEGAEPACRDLLGALSQRRTPGHVTNVSSRWDQPRGGLAGFVAK